MASKSQGKAPADQAKLEVEWLRIGISGPARKALVEAKLYKVSDLRKVTLQELTELHGMGKSSIARIQVIMRAKKISFNTH
jgi:DNA repair protein RadC